MSKIVAPAGVVATPLMVAEAAVNSTVPKSPKGTKEQLLPSHSSKSSTIHSASYSQSASLSPEKVLVTVLPVVTFSMTAEPAVLLVAVTVILMESPAEMVISKLTTLILVFLYYEAEMGYGCTGVSWVPFIPSSVFATDPLETSLENSSLATVTIDSDLDNTSISK
jgi:hypothetical protein